MMPAVAFRHVRTSTDPATEARPRVVAVGTALPPHRYTQSDLAALASSYLADSKISVRGIERFFKSVGVEERHLALPADRYPALRGLGERNDAWIACALALGQRAIEGALDAAGLRPRDISLFATTTITGLAIPSLEARLMNVLPFDPATKRLPLFGLGCLAGAAGLARVSEYLRAFPEEAALFLSVELCSLTFQPDDGSIANLVSTGLFGDGAAAVVLTGARHASSVAPASRPRGLGPAVRKGPRVLASRSVFFPNTERTMGWDVVDSGFKIVLGPEVPSIVEAHAAEAVDGLLEEHGLVRGDIDAWIMHPGGPKVIDALERTLELPPNALERTRRSLARVGNLSSASVLFLLEERTREGLPPGSYAVLMAMGPAFSAEVVLLRW